MINLRDRIKRIESLHRYQQNAYVYLLDNWPIVIEDDIVQRRQKTLLEEAFWRGVLRPHRSYYPKESVAYGAFLAGCDSRDQEIIKQAQ